MEARREEVDSEVTVTATEEIEKAAMEEGPGPMVVVAATKEWQRREVSGEMGLAVRRWQRIWTPLRMPRSPKGRTPRRNKVADGDHGRGLVDDGEDSDGEDGRRSRLIGEQERKREGEREGERREEVEQRGSGAGERRAWREKIREVVGFKELGMATKRDGEGGERWRRKEERDRRRLTAREERRERGTKDGGVIVGKEGRRGRQRHGDGNEGNGQEQERRKERELGNEGSMAIFEHSHAHARFHVGLLILRNSKLDC